MALDKTRFDIDDFSGGLNERDADSKILMSECVYPTENITLSRRGAISKRPGTVKHISAPVDSGNPVTGLYLGYLQRQVFWSIWGQDRYHTAAEIARKLFEESETVVIANGEYFEAQYVDSCIANALTGALNAPLLLTTRFEVPDITLTVMRELGVRNIYLVGNIGAIDEDIEESLKDDPEGFTVTRLGNPNEGRDREQTARIVAEEVDQVASLSDTCFIVHRDSAAEAALVGPAVAGGCDDGIRPIFFVGDGYWDPEEASDNENLGVANTNTISSLGFTKAIIMGDTDRVSSSIESDLNSLLGAENVSRIGGRDRYKTATLFADYLKDNYGFGNLVISNGDEYHNVDAASAGLLSAVTKAVHIYISQGSVYSYVHDFLEGFIREGTKMFVIGGPEAVQLTRVPRPDYTRYSERGWPVDSTSTWAVPFIDGTIQNDSSADLTIGWRFKCTRDNMMVSKLRALVRQEATYRLQLWKAPEGENPAELLKTGTVSNPSYNLRWVEATFSVGDEVHLENGKEYVVAFNYWPEGAEFFSVSAQPAGSLGQFSVAVDFIGAKQNSTGKDEFPDESLHIDPGSYYSNDPDYISDAWVPMLDFVLTTKAEDLEADPVDFGDVIDSIKAPPPEKWFLAVSGTYLKRLVNREWETIKSDLTPNQDMEFLSYNHGIYMVNGKDGYFALIEDLWTDQVVLKRVKPYMPSDEELESLGPNALPEDPKYIAFHYERVWLASVSGSQMRVFMSDIGVAGEDRESPFKMFRPDYFPANNYFDVPCQMGDKVTGMVIYQDRPHIFTKYNIWTIYGTTPQEYDLVKVRGSVGAISHRSIKEVKGMLLFHSMDGPVAFDGTNTYELYEKIPDTLKRIDKSKEERAAAVVYDNRYYLGLPEEEQNDMVLEFDLYTDLFSPEGQKSWVPHKGFTPICWLVDDENNCLFGGSNGYIHRFGEGWTDDGTEYRSIYTTKSVDGNNSLRFRRFRVKLQSVDSNITFRYRIDYGRWASKLLNMREGPFGKEAIVARSIGANIIGDSVQMQFDHKGNSPFYIQAVTLEAYVKRLR